jgi:hypothetical protein
LSLNLFGVTVSDAHLGQSTVANTELLAVRDLAAICGYTENRAIVPEDEAARLHGAVVAAYASRSPVLPAPVGIVFRGADSVRRWLELHYGALTDALSFVENRVAGRVYLWSKDDEARAPGSDVTSIAAESLRALRRTAVATVPLRIEKGTGLLQSAAFLVQEDRWDELVALVAGQSESAPGIRFELTGPWPPYDFVQMQLGA